MVGRRGFPPCRAGKIAGAPSARRRPRPAGRPSARRSSARAGATFTFPRARPPALDLGSASGYGYLMSEPSAENTKDKGGRPRNPEIRGELLRAARRERRLSRAKVVKSMGEIGYPVSVDTLQSWETGQYRPPSSRLAAVCTVLNLKPEDVLVASASSKPAA
jgi:DNA-binding transcriptional regulator YiaG